ncbi:hypothetical protein FDH48_gp62 [Arthrobacter phage Jawnski]|uniref:Uncharacterized protein n=2 Tax=Jawnskivirus TaxID=3425003 RepID=A0A0M4RBA4_9CAUD|nr:hypothetical protein FDH47_gp63 [Arthrobacter phage Brent]YP_009601622.1 hypothetical protein FDH48_gp62 [Arthrobacter phage Jawnski]ALF01274.1 hypothetical protein SEA_BRENT_63 [Arthrobacter phage Brent]ALY09391.1 hypothetical protein JAWNSKI_62 [Arthrobacter phage Jawnski]
MKDQQIFIVEGISERGGWEVLFESTDPATIFSDSLKLSMERKSMRSTALYGADAEAYIAMQAEPKSAPAERQGKRVPRIGDPVVYYQGSMKRIVPAFINRVFHTVDPETDMKQVGLFIMWPDREDSIPPTGYRPYSAELSSGCWSWPDAVPDAL